MNRDASERAPEPAELALVIAGGQAGARIRAIDDATVLGPVRAWPQSLRTSVSLCLSSTFPLLVAWGPDDIQIYNDAYRPICGDLHPRSMGGAFKEIQGSLSHLPAEPATTPQPVGAEAPAVPAGDELAARRAKRRAG